MAVDLNHIDIANSNGEYTSTADVLRTTFNSHPWSIGGGGAAELKEQLDEACDSTLETRVTSIGFASFPGLDDAFVMDGRALLRNRIDSPLVKDFIYGEVVKDWHVEPDLRALAPYDNAFQLVKLDYSSGWARYLWNFRTCLEGVVSFGGRTRKDNGDAWWGWYRWIPEKYRTPLSIVYREIATHNNFIMDRGGKVSKHSVQLIKLPSHATEKEFLGLVGLLNSSTGVLLDEADLPRQGRWWYRRWIGDGVLGTFL